MSPRALEELLEQVGRTGRIPANVLSLVQQHLRALSFSLTISAAVGQPIISIHVEGRDEKSAEAIKETIQSLMNNARTALVAMSEEAKQALPISADFTYLLLNAVSVEVNGTQVNVVLTNFETLKPTITESLNTFQAAVQPELLLRKRMEQLKGIRDACAQYYQEHQKFPADILDTNGNPLLSWRVALLPTLGFEDLYEQFNLDEPWDSETNLAVLNESNLKPLIFHPLKDDVAPPKTVIRFFDSAGTPFSNRDLKVRDLKSPETTLMFVVVSPKYAVEWTRPDSLEFDIDTIAETLGFPQFWGITFSGRIRAITNLPDTDPKYDEWKQYVESVIKDLPVQEQ
jgi:hypothetical protein